MADLIAELRAVSDLKVWSVLVTLFGDMALAEDARLSGPRLRALLGPLGIQPEAVRVALHRLRKDGWITAERAGRIGQYGLSARGRAETEAVAERVYGANRPTQSPWFLVVQPDELDPPKQGLSLGHGRFLCPEDVAPPALSAPLQRAIPSWVIAHVLPEGLDAAFATLETLVSSPVTVPDDAEEAAVLRLLILHHWRRLVLRTPPLGEALLGADWSGGRCRTRVHAWLSALPVPETAPAP